VSEVKKCMHIVFIDTLGKERDALVTAVHGPADKNPSVNLVCVNTDDTQYDSYGNKTERASSVGHQSNQWAHGNMWRFADEPRVQKTA
jgi:hypothetical protein